MNKCVGLSLWLDCEMNVVRTFQVEVFFEKTYQTNLSRLVDFE
jgi:hypothetical protein